VGSLYVGKYMFFKVFGVQCSSLSGNEIPLVKCETRNLADDLPRLPRRTEQYILSCCAGRDTVVNILRVVKLTSGYHNLGSRSLHVVS